LASAPPKPKQRSGKAEASPKRSKLPRLCRSRSGRKEEQRKKEKRRSEAKELRESSSCEGVSANQIIPNN
jgi:hypothetical protein